MNKKNILILIATIVVAAVVFSFAAANADACKHEHTWDRWTVLDNCHKLIVQCTDCGNKIVDNSKFDSHVFVDGVCKCGKTDPNYQPLNIDLDIEEPEEEPEPEPEKEPEPIVEEPVHEHSYVATESIYDQYKDKYHFITTTMTCSCGDKYYTGLIEEHNYEDYGYLGDGVMHKKQLKCSDCGRYTYDGEEEACDLIQLEAADAEPHEYEGRLYQGFRFKCSVCGVEVINTIDLGPVHVHDMKLEVINDSEYRYACTCGEATDIEVFEWDLIFNNGRNVVYEDAATGCQKHYAYTRTSVDGNDHKVTVNEYIDNSSSGIIYMNREDYTEPHNIVTTMNLVNYSEWYERCSDCGYEASHAFNWILDVDDGRTKYYVDANGSEYRKTVAITYYDINDEQTVKGTTTNYWNDSVFVCSHSDYETIDKYIYKTRVLGISYYEAVYNADHYYRYTTDEGEVLFFDSLFDAVESKLGRELRDREWIIVNHLRETRCETF